MQYPHMEVIILDGMPGSPLELNHFDIKPPHHLPT
jgi:hypothetical protein